MRHFCRIVRNTGFPVASVHGRMVVHCLAVDLCSLDLLH